MAYIQNALPYRQKQVLPPMLPGTTHPTTITRFQISLDTKKITQKGFKLVSFDMKFQFFLEFINFIGNLFQIFQNVSVYPVKP